MKLNKKVADLLDKWFDGDVKAATYPNLAVCCPWCIDRKYRLYMLTEQKGKYPAGTGYCQNCPGNHTIVELYELFENVSRDDAVSQLYEANPEPLWGDAAVALQAYDNRKQSKKNKELPTSPVQWPPPHYKSLAGLTDTEWHKWIPSYMKERKITQEMCNQYQLGYCSQGSWVNRMVIPIFQDGKLVGSQARAMFACKNKKYLFSTGVKIGSYLYNLDLVPAEFKSVILVEGVFDVWGVIRAGFQNVVASFGKHLTEVGRSKLLKRFIRVYVMWDDDAILEIDDLARELEGYIEVYICRLNGKDPDEATTQSVTEAVSNAQIYSKQHKYEAMVARMSMK